MQPRARSRGARHGRIMPRIIDPEQISGELLQLGTVASVDHAQHTCIVTIGDLETGDLPWLAGRAGAVRIWSPPSIGEQCAVLVPEGDLANGLVLLGLFSDANPPPSNDPDVVHIEMPDGAVLAYNHASHALQVALPAGGAATIDASGGTTWNGPVTFNNAVTVNDDVTVNAKLTASTDVVGGGISLKSHKHPGVQSGGSQTGAPA